MEFNRVLMATVVVCVAFVPEFVFAKRTHYIHWNKNNPMFRLDNTDHVIDVNGGNLPWEYDQVNIICPVSKPDVRFPERHVIYSVSKEEFDSCRITNPKPKIVAVCAKPHQLLYFTITFRSFTPTPGGLEFYPGQDYYFISTSSREDLHRRVGGGCATHNMKMIFRVADNGSSRLNTLVEEEEFGIRIPKTTTTTTTTTERPRERFNAKSPYHRNYYYHPRDLVNDIDESAITSYKRMDSGYIRKPSNKVRSFNLGWNGGNEAMPYTSGSKRSTSVGLMTSTVLTMALTLLLTL